MPYGPRGPCQRKTRNKAKAYRFRPPRTKDSDATNISRKPVGRVGVVSLHLSRKIADAATHVNGRYYCAHDLRGREVFLPRGLLITTKTNYCILESLSCHPEGPKIQLVHETWWRRLCWTRHVLFSFGVSGRRIACLPRTQERLQNGRMKGLKS